MVLLLLVAIALGIAQTLSASCAYSNYGPNDLVLVADENCKSDSVCYVDYKCTAHLSFVIPDPTKFYFGGPFNAIGNMLNYNFSILSIGELSKLTTKDMKLPSGVQELDFTNISSLDLTVAFTSSWSNLSTLKIFASPNNVIQFPSKYNWPPNLSSLELYDYNKVPEGLPSSITKLQLFGHKMKEVSNCDWKKLTFLNLGGSSLETFANVQLSSALRFFYIQNTKLSNITIDENTAIALNTLGAWGQKDTELQGFSVNQDITTSPSQCTAIGGSIKPLFQGKTTFQVNACVIPTSKTTPTTSPSSSSTTSSPSTDNAKTTSITNTGVIVGVVIGVVVVIAIAIAVFTCIRRKKKPKMNDHYEPFSTEGTATVRNPRLPIVGKMVDIDLDVTYLRHHRIELSDLVVTSNKALTSGAYGEVWLGTYGGQRVAIKRAKTRDPRLVQMFIDEISLLSQLDSPYIIKFIGASWTRPIEMECVVEYMDLGDLRNYLMVQTPDLFTWELKYESIISIIRGLVYLHTYNPPIVHRDMKSRNVLLDSVKGTKLTDFGTSRAVEEDDTMTNGIGTYQWMAPEVIAGTNYGPAADIYSFGIILSEFCTHQVPYANLRHPQSGIALRQLYVVSEVREGRLQPSFDGVGVPSWVKEVAMQCLQLNEHDRPSAMQLCAILTRLKQ